MWIAVQGYKKLLIFFYTKRVGQKFDSLCEAVEGPDIDLVELVVVEGQAGHLAQPPEGAVPAQE